MTVGATINVGGVIVERLNDHRARFGADIVLRLGDINDPDGRYVILDTVNAHELGEALIYVAGVNAREATP